MAWCQPCRGTGANYLEKSNPVSPTNSGRSEAVSATSRGRLWRIFEGVPQAWRLRAAGPARLVVVSRVVGVVCCAGVALLVVAPPLAVDNYGILQRGIIGAMFGWPVVAGILASRHVQPPGSTPPPRREVGIRGSWVGSRSHPAVRLREPTDEPS
jgi:hypothetical protein